MRNRHLLFAGLLIIILSGQAARLKRELPINAAAGPRPGRLLQNRARQEAATPGATGGLPTSARSRGAEDAAGSVGVSPAI